MSALGAAETAACPSCGAHVPEGARFCPACGLPLEEAPPPSIEELPPPEETGPVPVHVVQAETRWFGVAPALLLLGLAVLAVGIGVALLVTGHWPIALIALGLGVLAIAAFLEVSRRKPDSEVARASASAVARWRERAGSAYESLQERQRAQAETARIRRELHEVDRAWREAALAFGAATYRGEDAPAADARARLAQLDARRDELVRELDERRRAAEERIQRAKLSVQDTMMVQPSEPYPPPDEGTPPTPTPVPEPYPPPDEGTPPQPPRIPEPGPDPVPSPATPPSPGPGGPTTPGTQAS